MLSASYYVQKDNKCLQQGVGGGGGGGGVLDVSQNH